MKILRALKAAIVFSFRSFPISFRNEMQKDPMKVILDKAVKKMNKHIDKNLIPKSRLKILEVDYKTGHVLSTTGTDLMNGVHMDEALIEIGKTMKEYRLHPEKFKDGIAKDNEYIKRKSIKNFTKE